MVHYGLYKHVKPLSPLVDNLSCADCVEDKKRHNLNYSVLCVLSYQHTYVSNSYK